MKQLSCLFCLIVICSMSKNKLSSTARKETFIQKIDDRYTNRIEIIHGNGFIKGFFYGVEVATNNRHLFFKAPLSDLVLNDTTINFILNKFAFSYEPFRGDSSSLAIGEDSNVVPILFKSPIQYLGSRSSDTLKIKRISAIYDSNFDYLIFIKAKGSP